MNRPFSKFALDQASSRRAACGAALVILLAAAGFLPNAQSATPAQLEARLTRNEKLTIVDVRSPSLYAQGHIPGAINIPASLCPLQKLPPLGPVVVYDSGLGIDDAGAAANAATALGRLPGIQTETLTGGYVAWEEAHLLTTHGKGATREALHYITYAQLKAVNPNRVLLVDLRRQPGAAGVKGTAEKARAPLTDLAQEFPGTRVVKSAAEARPLALSGAPPLVIFVDNADGTAETAARLFKAQGSRRYAILAGGEAVLARKGQRGLERSGTGSLSPSRTPKTATPSH